MTSQHRAHAKVSATTNKVIHIRGRVVGPRVKKTDQQRKPAATKGKTANKKTAFKAKNKKETTLSVLERLDMPLDAFTKGKGGKK